jgi:hypothetical protein
MFDYIDRLVIVSLFPFLKQDWGLSDAQCGLLVSAVYWSILVFTLPVSVLIDRWSRKKSIGLMSLLWSFATLACAFATGTGSFFAARAMIGLGRPAMRRAARHDIGPVPGGETGKDTGDLERLHSDGKRAGHCVGRRHRRAPWMAPCIRHRRASRIPGRLLFFRVKDYKTIELVKSAASRGKAQAPA